MFQQTFALLKGFPKEDIFVVTGKMYESLVKEQVPLISQENIILEPEMKDTLACVGFAAINLAKRFPNCIVASVWGADHYVRHPQVFVKALKVAEQMVKKKKELIANIDVRPTFPSVHLGYMQTGKMVDEIDGFGIFEFVRQIEKPNLTRARKFFSSWNYLWHTGYSVWAVETMLGLYKKHAQGVYQSLERMKKALDTSDEERIIKEEYHKIPKNSIDFAIYEKIDRGKQVEIAADLGWSDVGAWNVLKDELAENEEDNVLRGQVIALDSKNSLVYNLNQNKLLAVLGLSDLIVVDTDEALLICHKDKAGEVKKIIEQIKEKSLKKFL